jgi:hypothetical protein
MPRGYWTDVHLSFASGDRIGKPKLPAARRRAALLGIFATLLQAILFGWHNHPLPFSPPGAPAVLAAGPPAGQEIPGLVDDDCQICFSLSHHGTAPVDFVAVPVSRPVPPHLPAVETVWVTLPSYVLFRSRAPPRV